MSIVPICPEHDIIHCVAVMAVHHNSVGREEMVNRGEAWKLWSGGGGGGGVQQCQVYTKYIAA